MFDLKISLDLFQESLNLLQKAPLIEAGRKAEHEYSHQMPKWADISKNYIWSLIVSQGFFFFLSRVWPNG